MKRAIALARQKKWKGTPTPCTLQFAVLVFFSLFRVWLWVKALWCSHWSSWCDGWAVESVAMADIPDNQDADIEFPSQILKMYTCLILSLFVIQIHPTVLSIIFFPIQVFLLECCHGGMGQIYWV